jgi:hypothetical protein
MTRTNDVVTTVFFIVGSIWFLVDLFKGLT